MISGNNLKVREENIKNFRSKNWTITYITTQQENGDYQNRVKISSNVNQDWLQNGIAPTDILELAELIDRIMVAGY